jgi:hypothetical protein
MSSKRNEIFKKASISLKISLKCHVFLKKALHSQKKPRVNSRIATMAPACKYLTVLLEAMIIKNHVKLKTGILAFCGLNFYI